MTRQTILKLAVGYEGLAASVPSMIESERICAEVLGTENDGELLQIIEPSFASAHRQVLALAAAMNKTAEILRDAIERSKQ